MASPKKGLSHEELKARFKANMDRTPEQVYREIRGWLYVYRNVQEQRMKLANRARQLDSSAKAIFWADVLPKDAVDQMDAQMKAAVEDLAQREASAAKKIDSLMRKTSWYQEVALPAARGIGMSPKAGMFTAAKILDAFGSMSRFQTIGQLMRYARLAPEGGQAPKRQSGQRIKYNPRAFQALFDLTDQWNRLPECHWRLRWDYWKAYYRERYPTELMTEVVEDGKRKTVREYPDGRILNMARRKVMREFLHDLWDLWRAWEAKQSGVTTPVEEAN